MPPVPGLEQHDAPFVLVVFEHAVEAAEAGRLSRPGRPDQWTPRYKPPSTWMMSPVTYEARSESK